MQRVYVQCDNGVAGSVSLVDPTRPLSAKNDHGPRSVGMLHIATSLPTGAGGRSHRISGVTSEKRNERVMSAPGSNRLSRHDQHRRAVRQHARRMHRDPASNGFSPQRQLPEEMKTPGAPTPDVLEFRWDRCLPDIDQTVAKR
jgi:hypothetical protein